MAVAMAHPDPAKLKRQKLNNLTSNKSEQVLLAYARLVLRVTPTVAQSVIAGEKPLAAAYEEAKINPRRETSANQ